MYLNIDYFLDERSEPHGIFLLENIHIGNNGDIAQEQGFIGI